MKKILITAGQTIEQIDPIRSISHASNGELGVIIAELALKKFKDIEIIFIADEQTIEYAYSRKLLEKHRMVFIQITDVRSLKDAIEHVFSVEKIDSVIHSMVVADYYINRLFSLDELVKFIEKTDMTKEDLLFLLKHPQEFPNQDKISSSEHENLTIDLKRSDKIFDLIHELSPGSHFIIFNNVFDKSIEELKEEGKNFFKKSHANYVITNDLKELKGNDLHNAFIIWKGGEEIFSWTGKGNGSKILLSARITDILEEAI